MPGNYRYKTVTNPETGQKVKWRYPIDPYTGELLPGAQPSIVIPRGSMAERAQKKKEREEKEKGKVKKPWPEHLKQATLEAQKLRDEQGITYAEARTIIKIRNLEKKASQEKEKVKKDPLPQLPEPKKKAVVEEKEERKEEEPEEEEEEENTEEDE